jgi:FdhD protein
MRVEEIAEPSSLSTFEAVSVRHVTGAPPIEEAVAEEVPVALEYNGIAYAVMFATPADLEDFALGFSLTEGILTRPDELYEIEVKSGARGVTVSIRIATECFVLLKERRRSLTGRTGCGLCGIESLDQAIRPLAHVTSAVRIDINQLHAGFAALKRQQRLMNLTGAVHAAAWLSDSGVLAHAREDVGRHNALDKTLGAAVEAGVDFTRGAAIITSRASFEMVHKAASLNIGLLAAISAPTALAIRTAEALGVTLVGFVRGERHAVYCHDERLVESARTPAELMGSAL